jgi:hypothetical protein
MAPNCSESRGISPVPGFQFLPKSESLGLGGTQLHAVIDMHEAQWANAEANAEEEARWNYLDKSLYK